ncbi:MAG: universal stress protein [Nocardioides sp.]|nr:universal stress protein [Nocardioides sp.]MDP3892721.1 universal stress protein [Nocardioides sp.]
MGYHTIVVGYDGSSDADLAVEAAADQTGPDGTVHVVTAFHPETNTQLINHLRQLPEEFRYVYDHHTAEKERQHTALARLQERGVHCTGHVVADDPATAIIDVARREAAELVVVGSRGLGAAQRYLRGSVSARVAAHAPTSVLIVHNPNPTPSG